VQARLLRRVGGSIGMRGSSVAAPWDPIFDTLVFGDERNGSQGGDALGVRDPGPCAEKRVWLKKHWEENNQVGLIRGICGEVSPRGNAGRFFVVRVAGPGPVARHNWRTNVVGLKNRQLK
jgi:hypothetical protein